jgi:hypothetical protein
LWPFALSELRIHFFPADFPEGGRHLLPAIPQCMAVHCLRVPIALFYACPFMDV